MDWYLFALLSFCFYTIQGLLLKLAAERKCDSALTTFYYLLTVSIISLPILVLRGVSTITTLGLTAAVIDGIFYCIAAMTCIGALKYIPASIVYPIRRLNDAVVVILFILLLHERITLANSLGIVLALISIYLLSGGEKKNEKGL